MNDVVKICLGVQQSMRDMGWTSVDAQGTPDIMDDVEALTRVPDDSCDVIVASHVLEHMPYQGWGGDRVTETIDVLAGWRRKLKIGGRLVVCVPDLDLLVELLRVYRQGYWHLENTVYHDVLGPLLGGGENEYNRHRMLYNRACLQHCLTEAGYTNIRKLRRHANEDWRKYNASAGHWSSMNFEARHPGLGGARPVTPLPRPSLRMRARRWAGGRLVRAALFVAGIPLRFLDGDA